MSSSARISSVRASDRVEGGVQLAEARQEVGTHACAGAIEVGVRSVLPPRDVSLGKPGAKVGASHVEQRAYDPPPHVWDRREPPTACTGGEAHQEGLGAVVERVCGGDAAVSGIDPGGRAERIELLGGETIADPPPGVLEVQAGVSRECADVVADYGAMKAKRRALLLDEGRVRVALGTAEAVVDVEDGHLPALALGSEDARGQQVQQGHRVSAAADHDEHRRGVRKHPVTLGGRAGDVLEGAHHLRVPDFGRGSGR